ncbi:MAG: 1,4-dihydroxy-2-naphthoate octaprenyltransferase [Candidatus Anoxychlamydiales bacterium]|nr:1,4-dihydroxy-2-naphthoate octaprenyltransferase [Candidatus Anoxychlamydiales bacterium]NGX35282.1 1,4-dihydroxy-2-naphthoate octaprenyltransferase [Candidatus Anoxychlamydiales bacterium]
MQNSIKTWLAATRAETLVASISPMLIGTMLASKITQLNYFFLSLTFLYGLLLHLGTNLSNDYYDYLKGADNENRIAPLSTIQTNQTSLNEIKFSFAIAFLAAFFVGLILIARGGAIAAALFALPIIFGYHYTAGKKPLGYMGLGEILVLLFFGPYACLGTYYLQTLTFSYLPILAGLGPGFLSVAVLVVNNLRDIDVDRPANKLTLAVRFGKSFAKIEYTFCVIAAFLVPFFYFYLLKKPFILSASLFIFFTPLKLIFNFKDPKLLNVGLQKTVLLLIIYTIIFSTCLAFY